MALAIEANQHESSWIPALTFAFHVPTPGKRASPSSFPGNIFSVLATQWPRTIHGGTFGVSDIPAASDAFDGLHLGKRQ